jgi:hypothetical protein
MVLPKPRRSRAAAPPRRSRVDSLRENDDSVKWAK